MEHRECRMEAGRRWLAEGFGAAEIRVGIAFDRVYAWCTELKDSSTMSSLEYVVAVRGLNRRTDSAVIVQSRPARVQLIETAASRCASRSRGVESSLRLKYPELAERPANFHGPFRNLALSDCLRHCLDE